jgi:hypothetical protein
MQLRVALVAYTADAPTDVDAPALITAIQRREIGPDRGRTASSRRTARSGARRPRAWPLLAAAALLLVPLIGSVLIGSGRTDHRVAQDGESAIASGLGLEGSTAPLTPGPVEQPVLLPVDVSPITIPSAEVLVHLEDGRVLVLGPGSRPQSLWEPSTGEYTPIGRMIVDRESPVAVRLGDGRVLIIGGDIAQDTPTSGHATYSTAEIYDPTANTFTSTGPLVGKGWAPSAILLNDGRVLVTDGISVDGANGPDPLLTTAEIYDPQTNTFTATGPMSIGRGVTHMGLLGDSRVLVAGGSWEEPNIVDLFDPTTDRFERTASFPPPGPAGDPKGKYWPKEPATALTLPDGRVLVAGRRCLEENSVGEGRFPTDAAIYDPVTERFTVSRPMPHCVESLTPLPGGRAFLTAFWAGFFWSGVYDPATDTVTDAVVPPGGRYMVEVGLGDGRVLMAAGDQVKYFDPKASPAPSPTD